MQIDILKALSDETMTIELLKVCAHHGYTCKLAELSLFEPCFCPALCIAMILPYTVHTRWDSTTLPSELHDWGAGHQAAQK